jgi:hypothetical protein
MPQLSADEQRTIEEMAQRHRVSPDAVLTLLTALQAGGGRQAQFSHPELGGMGQWSRGGMIMIGDMFNTALKARVDSLCGELSAWLGQVQDIHTAPTHLQSQSQGHSGGDFFSAGSGPAWWPSDLGTPASVGAQNDLRYAYFPAARRLATNYRGQISLHDTGRHRITGVSQQQGASQSITFTSQHGLVRLAELPLIELADKDDAPEPSATQPTQTPANVPSASIEAIPLSGRQNAVGRPADDIIALIERLAELRRKDILSEEEFTAKKAELLSRL